MTNKTPLDKAQEYCDRRYGFNSHEYDAYLAGYEEAEPKWISVNERLPEEDKDVLIYVPSKNGDSAHWVRDYHINGKWIIHGYEPTHWMPLPEPPST